MTDEHDEVSIQDLACRLGVQTAPDFEVHRTELTLDSGGTLSALRWGAGEPEVVLIHGGGQNAHTWDAVAVALGAPALAVDLPGHGHSSWREDRDYWPWTNAAALEQAVAGKAPRAKVIVGMSLGGLTAIRLRALRPDLVRRLILVDVTPSSGERFLSLSAEGRGSISLIDDDPTFGTFEDMFLAVHRTVPDRDPEVLRRGVGYNARQLGDGRWRWRYDDLRGVTGRADFSRLWADLDSVRSPVVLAVAEHAGIVTAGDEAAFLAATVNGSIVHFDTSDHSVQSVFPVELAELIRTQLDF
jgi:esterase